MVGVGWVESFQRFGGCVGMNTYQEPCTDCLVGQSVLAYLGMAHLCTCIEMIYIRIQKM